MNHTTNVDGVPLRRSYAKTGSGVPSRRTHAIYLAITILLTTTTVLLAKEKSMTIQVRQGQLRSAPSYLSRITENLEYASRVTILEEKGTWLRVKPAESAKEGWMHSSALTKKKLKLSAGEANATTTVSSEEQALAGRGFNSDVEAEFKENNAEIDFTWVNKMEKIKIKTPTLIKFLKKGDIKAPAENAQ